MIVFCENIIDHIKSASSDEELNALISDSLLSYRAKSPQKLANYVLNMIVALQATKADQLTPETERNIEVAIDIFRELRKQNPDRVVF